MLAPLDGFPTLLQMREGREMGGSASPSARNAEVRPLRISLCLCRHRTSMRESREVGGGDELDGGMFAANVAACVPSAVFISSLNVGLYVHSVLMSSSQRLRRGSCVLQCTTAVDVCLCLHRDRSHLVSSLASPNVAASSCLQKTAASGWYPSPVQKTA